MFVCGEFCRRGGGGGAGGRWWGLLGWEIEMITGRV